MSHPEDLRVLERSVYRAHFDDGLVDLLFGVVVLAWGAGLILGIAYLGALAAGVSVTLWPVLRQRISHPRTGHVELSRSRRSREGRKALASVAAGVALLALVAIVASGVGGSFTRTPLDSVGAGLGGFLLALPALLVMAATGVGRFGVHAAVFVVCGLLGMLGVLSLEVSVLAGGMAVLALGAVQLLRFIRTHPLPGG